METGSNILILPFLCEFSETVPPFGIVKHQRSVFARLGICD
jgi:hypothetical protein